MGKKMESRALPLVVGVLLFAMAPSLSYLGHWPSPASHIHSGAAGGEHVAHCHEDVSGCSGGPASVGVPGLSGEEVLAMPQSEPRGAPVSYDRAEAVPGFSSPQTPPPRLSA